jgi:uncharacterized protein involved in tolerance to divalent cations
MSNELSTQSNNTISTTFTFSPRNLDEAMRLATMIANSDLAPKDYKGKPGNVLVAIQMGEEVGLKPMQALQNIAVISGRPSLWGDAMLALVKAHPEFEDMNEWFENGTAHCMIKRRNQTAQTRTFSVEQAKKAGLKGKAGPWTNYEERMLQMRARGFCIRDVFPDAIKGLQMAEEVIDLPKDEPQHIQAKVVEANQRLGHATAAQHNFRERFAVCTTADELKAEFEKFKLIVQHSEIQALIKAKDQRKSEIEAMQSRPEPVIIETTISNEEWLEEFDKTEVK